MKYNASAYLCIFSYFWRDISFSKAGAARCKNQLHFFIINPRGKFFLNKNSKISSHK